LSMDPCQNEQAALLVSLGWERVGGGADAVLGTTSTVVPRSARGNVHARPCEGDMQKHGVTKQRARPKWPGVGVMTTARDVR